MPGGDGTGPSGGGPRTGRRVGRCSGGKGQRRGQGGRRGLRRGAGGGRGRRAAAAPAETATTTDFGEGINTIQHQVERLATTLDGVQKRIAELQQQQA